MIDNNRREPSVAEQFRGGAWLAVAQGHWVTYLDDDDAYRPGKLARQHALASATGAPAVLCGACFHLQGRTRAVQCDRASWTGDDLILRARWNTPLLFHRRSDGTRFDESLPAGEDAEFAHRLLQAAGGRRAVGRHLPAARAPREFQSRFAARRRGPDSRPAI